MPCIAHHATANEKDVSKIFPVRVYTPLTPGDLKLSVNKSTFSSIILLKPKLAIKMSESSAGVRKRIFSGFSPIEELESQRKKMAPMTR